MKVSSKIERLALDKIESEAGRLVSIETTEDLFDPCLFFELEKFWASKSPRILVEKSIYHVASTLLKEEKDLLELSRPDRLQLLSSIEKYRIDRHKANDQHKIIKIKIPAWQLLLILSQAEININSAPMLIEFCLKKSILAKSVLFGRA